MKQATLTILTLASLAGCNSRTADSEPRSEETVAVQPLSEKKVAAQQTCKQFVSAPDEPPVQHEVPARLAAFVTATETTITVQRKSGKPACLDVTYGEVDAWDSLAQGRLLGVGISGHEYNSYLVVDRHGSGEPIETGRAPAFSPSGRLFASVDVSESAFGAFEALGVWELSDRSIRSLAKIEDLLARGDDWRLVRWASDDCLVFSTAADPSDPDLKERNFHELRLSGRPAMKSLTEAAACDG